MLLEALNILENFDLKAMKHNSPDYVHTVVEALKLAYADRDTYYADPEFVRVPAEGLLSKAYAKERAKLIDPKAAHFHGSFWPHNTGLNVLNVESNAPEALFTELAKRGHDIKRVRPFSINGCGTAVLIDPATGNRIAGAERRRDCYAMAY